MRWFAPALASVAIVLAVFGVRGAVVEHADASPSPNQAVLGIAAAHPAPAIAERLPDPIGATSSAFVAGAVFAVAGLLFLAAISRVTDRRALAIATGLRCRRRGPPLQFTV
jgi:hypothetical protein